MFGIDDLVTGGLNLAGGMINNWFAGKRQDEAQQFNSAQAAINRQWQEQMSNTAHQREAADMQAAGLNRILAVGKGASTPGGATASTTAAPVHDMLGPAVNTAMAHSRLKEEIANMKETNRNISMDTRKKQAEEFATYMGAHRADAETSKIRDENMIVVENLADAKTKAAIAKIKHEQLQNPAYRVLHQTGNIGEEVQRGTSAISNLPSFIGAMRKRGVEPTDFDETTYHPRGETTIKERKFKRR